MEPNNAYRLAELESRQLRELLQTEVKKPLAEIDPDLVLALRRELNGRKPELADDEAVEEACDKFRREMAAKPRRRWFQSSFLKVASILLVLSIMLAAVPRVAEAQSLKDVLTRWTDRMFQFFDPGEQEFAAEDYEFRTDNPDLQKIYDAVTELGVTQPVVPMWIPSGYILKDLVVFDFEEDTSVFACLTNEDNCILITITVITGETSFQHEKNLQNVKVLELSGIEHYIISNVNEKIVTWMTNGIECSIVADCQEEDLNRLLESIYIPED